ncbi:NAD(P)-binding domain-containing protein [Streptomyces sp. NPDC047072]|uniref:NAD(P)-binding domain-containing protein n=1 Tax=Streptomyces sp. NPDC047072 TaxID=3154809 RepID=UPI0033F149C3
MSATDLAPEPAQGKERMSTQIAAVIRDRIEDGTYPPGSVLPPRPSVSVYDIAADRRAALAASAGARDAASPAEAARDAEVVVLAVRDQTQVEGALFGTDGAAEALLPGAVVILTSTVGPEAAHATATRLAEQGEYGNEWATRLAPHSRVRRCRRPRPHRSAL